MVRLNGHTALKLVERKKFIEHLERYGSNFEIEIEIEREGEKEKEIMGVRLSHRLNMIRNEMKWFEINFHHGTPFAHFET